MGGEDNGLQTNQIKQQSKSINQTQAPEMRKRAATIGAIRPVKAEENSNAVKNVFEIKTEPVEQVDLMKKEPSTQNESHEESEARRYSAASMPDLQLEQRRKSILQGSPLPAVEKKQYVKEYERWQELKQSYTTDYKKRLGVSNEKIQKLTNKLLGDRRSASDSYERVRQAMVSLVKLSMMDDNSGYIPGIDNFSELYEHAYRAALDAVEQYLQSHASWRKTFKGWQRKRWMEQLQMALLGHVEFATDIVSKYSEYEQAQGTVKKEDKQSREQSAAKTAESEKQSEGQAELEKYYMELRQKKHPSRTQQYLSELIGEFLHYDYRQPQNRVRSINLFWTIKNMFIEQKNDKLSDVMDILLVDMGMNQEEINAQLNLPSLKKNVEFFENISKTKIPANDPVHWMGDSESLEKYLEAKKKLLKKEDITYLENRIHVAKRIEALEAKKTNVAPPPCAVYLNGVKTDLNQIDKKNMDQYKFILEDVHQANFQTHGNSCWSAAAENLFRQRGTFIHQVDMRGFRDSEMDDAWINVLKGNNKHEIHGIRHLVGKVMKNTMLRSRQFRGVEDTKKRFSKARQNNLKLQLKDTIREAISEEHSAIAICFGNHYRTIVGIEGDKVYYKDSLYSKYPDETHEMTIDAIIDGARGKREFAGKDGYTFPIELFWMKDIPVGTDIAKEYQGKIDKTVSVKKDSKNRLYLSYENPDNIMDDQTTVCIQPESRLQGKDQPAIINRDYVPRVIA